MKDNHTSQTSQKLVAAAISPATSPAKHAQTKDSAMRSSLASFIANLGSLTLYPLEAIKTRLQGAP